MWAVKKIKLIFLAGMKGNLPEMVLFALFIIMFCSSCNNGTDPENAKITGTISMEGTSDWSGIRVWVYSLAVEDSVFSSVNNDATSITFIPNQRHYFDPVKDVPLAQTETDETGHFSLQVPAGVYNLAIFKEGYSTKVAYEKILSSGNINVEVVFDGQVILTPVIHFSGVYTSGEFTINNQNDVYIDSETFFFETTSLTISNGARVYIAPNTSLHIYGSLNWMADSSNPAIFNVQNDTADSNRFFSIRFNATTEITRGLIDGLVVLNSTNGLLADGCTFIMRNSLMNCSNACLTVNNVEGFAIDNVLLRTSSSSVNYIIDVSNSSDVQIMRSVIYGGDYGIRFNVVTNGMASDSHIRGRLQAVAVENDSDTVIEYCDLMSTTVGIRSYLRSQVTFIYNNLSAPLGYDLGGAYTSAVINYCNLYSQNTAVKYLAHYGGDLDARNCYWNTTDPDEIAMLIIDKNDFESNHQYYDRYNIVIYNPFRTSTVTNAGVR